MISVVGLVMPNKPLTDRHCLFTLLIQHVPITGISRIFIIDRQAIYGIYIHLEPG